MKAHDFKHRKIWLTGASSGIGNALAKQLIAEGAKVIVSARNETKLNELVALNPDNVTSVPFDVTQKDCYEAICQKVETAYQGIDIVILNAGDCQYIDPKQFDAEKVHNMIHVNFMSMVYAIEKILPAIRQSQNPHIVAMSSAAAYTGLSRSEAYGSSKAAVKYFFESLRVDLYHEKIPITIICPGFIKTPLTDKNDFPMPMRISADKAAQNMIKGIKRYKKEIHTPWLFVAMLRFISILPLSLKTKLLSLMVKK